MIEFILITIGAMVVAYVIGRVIGIPAILITILGSVYLATLAYQTSSIRSILLSLLLLVLTLVVMLPITVIGAARGTFD